MPRTIVITGASSGIGRALALACAGAGVRLGLLGRDSQRLDAVAADCRAAGSLVDVALIDVRDRSEMATWLERIDNGSPVDLLFVNAGVMEGTPPGGDIESAEPSYELMRINVLGMLNTVQPLLPRMMERRRGLLT